MAGVKDNELESLAGWPLGLANLTREDETPDGALRDALNVDLTATGKPQRRPGYAAVYAGTDCHSGWSDDYLPYGFMVDGDTLYVVHADNTQDALVSGLAIGLPVSYVRINDAVYWSNGVQSGQITAALEAIAWACPNPLHQPALAPAADGTLSPGLYQVTCTFLDALGRESGCARAVPLTLTATGGIAVSNIPQPPAGGRVRLYATGGNDGVLRAAVTLDAGIGAYTLTAPPQGRPCNTQFLRPLPAGQLVAYGNGRQFVARGKFVHYSPTLRYGLTDPRGSAVSFVKRVQMMAFVGDGTDGAGLYVADGKRTYWLGAPDPKDWKQVIAHSYSAVPGQLAWVPGEVFPELQTKTLLPVWLSTAGTLCVGLPGGQVFQPAPANGPQAVIDAADRAALLFRKDRGGHRFTAALQGAGKQNLAFRDQLVMREYRHDK